jgi:hypothetical protein
MPLLVNSVPNLAQGVSQQPDNLRYPGQCDEQINAWATVVEGLVKRPPTTYTKKIDSSDPGANLFTHFVKRSEQNKYCVNVSLGGVGVINVENGAQIPVAVTSIANSYLSLGSSVTNPLADLRALTVADYTFLVNKNRVIQKASDSYSKTPEESALVIVKLGDFEKSYTVYINNEVVSHRSVTGLKHTQAPALAGTTYESGASGQAYHADTTIIAHDLELILDDHLTNTGQVGSIAISNGGTGWLDGGDTGLFTGEVNEAYTDTEFGFIPVVKVRKVTRTYENKLELRIKQANTNATATALLTVRGGIIQTGSIYNAGDSFNTDTAANPLSYTYIPKRRVKKDGRWKSWETLTTAANPEFFGSGQSLSVGGILSSTAFSVEREGSVIKITNASGPFEIRVEDGLGNQALGVVYKEVSSINELPLECYNDFIVKVGGDAELVQDDYYVKFLTKDKRGGFGEGKWIETVGWYSDESGSGTVEALPTLLADGSMPLTLIPFFKSTGIAAFRLESPNEPLLVKNGGSYYFLKKDHTSQSSDEPGVGASWQTNWQLTSITNPQGYLDWEAGVHYYGGLDGDKSVGWAARGAGDDNTNPFPSFVGKTIRDIFFFKNRLGILTDSNVIFSEADEYYNFFRTTTQQLLDSAPIDVGLSHTKVAILEHAVPFQEKLMLFSQGSQFVLRGADVLSPKTVAISPATEYDLSDGIQPVALGNYIYFPFKRNDFEGVYEYFVDNNTETFNAEEITQQVPKYITSDVQKIVGSQAENTIVMSTTADARTLFVYKYFWSNKEKIQSAWMKFTFGRDIRGFDFIDSNLHLITADSDGLHLEKLTLEDGITDAGLDYTLYLDSKVNGDDLTVSLYNPATKVTRVSGIPYNVNINTDATIYTKLGNERAFTVVDSSTVDVSGPLASYVDYGGDYVTYNSEYYYCINTHTSTSTFESNNWTKALHPPSGEIDAWAPSTSYVQGTIYKCDTNHTSTASDTPDTSDNWSTSSEVIRAVEWGANVFYNNDTYFVLGLSYNMLYRFSDQSLKQPTERGGRSASDYTYQTIRNGSINYADTGHFTVEVTPKYRDKYSYAFNPDSLGANLTLNSFTPQNGHFRFPIQCQPNDAKIEVVTDSALPVKLLAAEFESMVISRSRRYGA